MLDKLSIKSKIALLLFFPIVAILLLSAFLLVEKTQVVISSQRVLSLMELSVKVSSLVHEQQKERGATGVFLGSKGTRFQSEVSAQRKETEKKKAELFAHIELMDSATYEGVLSQKMSTALQELEKIGNVRNQVDAQTISSKDALKYYTGLNALFLNAISSIQNTAKDPDVVVSVSAYVNFLKSKELMGVERAMGTKSFSEGFTPQTLAQFRENISRQNSYLEVFRTYASDSQNSLLDKILSDPIQKEAERMRGIALSEKVMGAPSAEVDSASWFDVMTKKINLAKEVEDALSSDITSLSKNLADQANKERLETAALVLLTLFVIAFVSYRVIHSIEGLISRFGDTSGKIVESVSSSAVQLQASSEQMSHLLGRTTEISHEVFSSSEQANENVQAVAAAAEELSATVAEIASSVSRTAEMSRQCSEDAQSSQQELASLQKVIGDVDQILQSINMIAEQTNLLALNATIEAARAGDAGKGFAVVASEVKGLAAQTQKMTEDITAKINAIKDSTSSTVDKIQIVISQIRGMDNATQSIAAAIEEQNSATSEISRNAQGAVQRTADVSEKIVDARESITESMTTSQNVQQAATQLAKEAVRLEENVREFINGAATD
jgi:methyl-accepting chemotaxis protein